MALGYTYDALTYTFDAQGTANYVAGEGFGFPGDSGSPFLATDFYDPGGGLPTLENNTIIGIDTYGPVGEIRNGALEYGVNIGVYANTLRTQCDQLMAAVPEPGTLVLLLMLVGCAATTGLVRRARVGRHNASV